MTKKKLAPAKDWKNRHIDDWIVTTFTEYLKAKHLELFDIDYAPFGNWGLEQGLIGNLIGTRSRKNPKPRTASNESVKRFIDEAFESYTPSKEWPGTNFGFIWNFRRNVWQQIQAEENTRNREEKAVNDVPSLDELEDWL